jgi:hypothetical protein
MQCDAVQSLNPALRHPDCNTFLKPMKEVDYAIIHQRPHFSSVPLAAESKSAATRSLEDATTAFSEIMMASDRSIAEDLLEKAQCVVIVPGMKKGAFIVGVRVWQRFPLAQEQQFVYAGIRQDGRQQCTLSDRRFRDRCVLLVMNRHDEDKLLSSRGCSRSRPCGRPTLAETRGGYQHLATIVDGNRYAFSLCLRTW